MANEWLSTSHLTKMAADIANSIGGQGSGHSVTITYREVTARTITATADTISDTATSTSMDAARFGPVTRLVDGKEMGGMVYRVNVADLTTAGVTEPGRQDTVTDGSVLYEVADWEYDPLRKFVDLFVVKAGT